VRGSQEGDSQKVSFVATHALTPNIRDERCQLSSEHV
jgi:hypothetical protein